MEDNKQRNIAAVIWFTGISGSGKTTLAVRLFEELSRQGLQCDLLDGDVVRDFFEGDLGYSRQERIAVTKRIAFAAERLSQNGIFTIVANISPYFEIRDFLRVKISNYHQIYCKASLAKVSERDVQGHYARYQTGELKNFIGLDDVYEEPREADVTVYTDTETVDESLTKIIEYLKLNSNITFAKG